MGVIVVGGVGEKVVGMVGNRVGDKVVGAEVGNRTVSGVRLYFAGGNVPAPRLPYTSRPVHTTSPDVLRMHVYTYPTPPSVAAIPPNALSV